MAEGEGNWLLEMREAEKERKAQEEFVWTLLTPEERAQATKTVYDKYGVAIASNDTVDLTATLEQINNALTKGGVDVSRYSSEVMNSFAKDLLALQTSHKSYMDRLTEQTAKAPEINWAERVSVLGQKARADYATGESKGVGRMDTFITSPLLDETDPVTTKNILGGS